MFSRIKKIQNILERGTAALIMSPANRFYLTGFRSSAGYVVVTPENAVFLTDFRYFEKAKSVIKACETVMLTKFSEQVKTIIGNAEKLYIETDVVSVSQFSDFAASLGVKISDDKKLSRLLGLMRSIKTKEEIDNIKAAQKITDDTFQYILPRITSGRTECEIMLDMEFFMRKSGSEGVAFDFIVVSGKNSSLPHGVPTDKRIEKGDFITMDFGAVVNGYRSDMTRTVAVGSASEEQKTVYNTVLKAQLAAIEAARTGVICKEVDKIARDIIGAAGYNGCFGHGLGHSVGLDIHENPSFNMRDETPLEEGMVITVEPGIYIENKFGVRIEDMIIITENGNENITKSPKELIVL